MKTRILFVVAAGIFGIFWQSASWAEGNAIEAEAPMDEVQAAYDEIRSGQLYEAAIRLITVMRDMPADTAAQAHEYLEPAYLLALTAAFLLDWPDRIEILNTVVDIDRYEADKLGIAGARVGLGLTGAQQQAMVDELKSLTHSPSRSVAAGALFLLSSPHFFKYYDHRKEMITRLFNEHPESSFGRYAARLNIYHNISVGRKSGLGQVSLLRDTPYSLEGEDSEARGGDDGQTLCIQRKAAIQQYMEQADPVLASSLMSMTCFTFGEITPDVILSWTMRLSTTDDADERCHLLNMLRYFSNDSETREVLEPVTRHLAERGDVTSRAFSYALLLRWAQSDDDATGIYQWTHAIIAMDRLAGAPEESLYESHYKLALDGAEHLENMGNVADAVQLYAMMAEKYPNSLVASECQARITILEDSRP